MIPKEHETYLIQSALGFVRALSEAYGPDEGLKLWENMNANLDPDIKGKVFFAMISGDYNNVIKMTGVSTGYEKVRTIKCIRTYTGLGLKESKDICDWLEQGVYKSIEVPPMERSKAMSELRQCGVWL
jgi:hypothetical protein